MLTDDAQDFIVELAERFEPARLAVLEARSARRQPGFLASTEAIRRADWKVDETPPDLRRREVEITGPAERKMMIHALNSGADVFMADFEDALSPTWRNIIEGQQCVRDANRRWLMYEGPSGERLSLAERTATLLVRPRGWHLEEQHVLLGDSPVSASLFDFGLFFFHNAEELLSRGSGPYLYLPKLESHHEARLWNEVFMHAQDALRIPRGSIRATVLIETLPAAFEMEEILFELRDHASGLNAGRWDYLFSVIKESSGNPGFMLPDRAQVTMTVPFMRAYTDLLVRTCHARGAQAIGGMAAFVPSRRDPEGAKVAFARVLEDKEREARQGFDGTWVAHPDLVPVARQAFLAGPRAKGKPGHRPEKLAAPNLSNHRTDEARMRVELLDFSVPGGRITEAGVTTNIDVCIRYISSWLAGAGAVAIRNLMEDAATAEIARSQLWLWRHRRVQLENGEQLAPEKLEELFARVLDAVPLELFPRKLEASELLRDLVFSETLPEFFTLEAYPLLAFASGVAA
jgi:malate synthase